MTDIPQDRDQKQEIYCQNTTKRHLRGVATKETIPEYTYERMIKLDYYDLGYFLCP